VRRFLSNYVDLLLLLFRGVIYQQKFGAAMGSPVFPFLANLFMELLEKKAIATAPFECKPKFFEVVCGRCFGTDNEGSSEEPYGVRTTLTPLIPLATSSSPTKRRRTSRSHFWTLF